jgi:hypothetical protein
VTVHRIATWLHKFFRWTPRLVSTAHDREYHLCKKVTYMTVVLICPAFSEFSLLKHSSPVNYCWPSPAHILGFETRRNLWPYLCSFQDRNPRSGLSFGGVISLHYTFIRQSNNSHITSSNNVIFHGNRHFHTLLTAENTCLYIRSKKRLHFTQCNGKTKLENYEIWGYHKDERWMNQSYVSGHQRARSLLFQCIVCILWILIKLTSMRVLRD